MRKLLIAVVVLIAILTVPQINYVAHIAETTYCEQRNEWVRSIIIKFIRIKAPEYPEGGICNG